jgi:hypothetical protein
LRALADGDQLCESTPGCPDEGWLEAHHVYVTSHSRVRISRLPLSSTDGAMSDDSRNTYRVTVVQIDENGTRNGEAFDTVTVRGPETLRVSAPLGSSPGGTG